MKTIQVSYMESTASRKWMLKNIQTQKQSEFIREAVLMRIELIKLTKKIKSKK